MTHRIIIEPATNKGFMILSPDGKTVEDCFGNYRELIFHLSTILRPPEEQHRENPTLTFDPNGDYPAVIRPSDDNIESFANRAMKKVGLK